MYNTNPKSGERLSFFELLGKRNYKVEIPIIQRDYAQGRVSNKEVRDLFVDALKSYLDERIPNRDLDFVYGSLLEEEINDCPIFIPLDGQQRLTTLFLLHWYIAAKEDKLESFREYFAIPLLNNNWQSKFTYETRTSAKEFCNAIVSASFGLMDIKNKTKLVSDIIKDQQWYFLSWKNDPTIQGMLVMLDAIHEKFKDEEKDYYDLLIDLDNPIITFQFLKLEKFGLTDDLYIKMNSRGKPLTAFENFKAKFEKQIKESEYNNKIYNLDYYSESVTLQKYFSHKIDTDWANLFWAYIKEELPKNSSSTSENIVTRFDNMVMNLFRFYIINYVAGKIGYEKIVEYLIPEERNISYRYYQENNCFDSQSVPKLISLLDILQNGYQKAKQFLSDFYYFNENIVKKLLTEEPKIIYKDRVIIHAYFEYLIEWSDKNNSTNNEGLKKWMRLLYNLSENKEYNKVEDFIYSIKGINTLLETSLDNDSINNYIIKTKVITGFDKLQIIEEIIKAHLIEKNTDWEKLIYKAEQHGYFNGQIGFLLRISGISKYYSKEDNCDWDDIQDNIFKERFLEYFEKASMIFNEKGLKNEYDKGGNFIWKRALLTIGDYLKYSKGNKSFLKNDDRDISWKRFLKDDNNGIVETIFDAFDKENDIKSLNTLINNYSNDDWKRKFITTPELFNVLGDNSFVREEPNYGFILLTKIQLNGRHFELYSYSLFLNYIENKNIYPFTKSKYITLVGKNESLKPHIKISNWNFENIKYGINIIFDNKDNKYELRFYSETDEFNDKIKPILENEYLQYYDADFLTNYYNYYNYYFTYFKTEEETIEKINSLCESFKELVCIPENTIQNN